MRLFEIENSKVHSWYSAPSKKYHKSGITLYHTTTKKNLKNILSRGLKPKPNKHEIDRYHDLCLTMGNDAPLPPSPPAIFTFPYPMAGEVILKFVTNATDTLGTAQYIEDEILVFNTISPDRLTVIE